MNNNIKIVMWDYGGVLTESPIKNFNKFENKFNYTLNSIVEINSYNKFENAWAKFEKNVISSQEFSKLFKKEAKAFGITDIDTQELLKCLDVKLNTKMINLLQEVSKYYTSICITNNFKYISSNSFKSIKSYFNHIFESSNLAMRKPEKKIYNYVLKNLGVKAEEILFIDDLGINLKPARLLGFHTYKFIDTKTTIDFVKNLLKI